MKEKCVHESGEAKNACPSKRRRPMQRHHEKAEACQSEGVGSEEHSPQWLFRRGELPEMMISEHLGDTSSMVESLTYGVKSWSLISSSKKVVSKKPEETTKQQRVNSSNRALMKILLGGSRENKEHRGGGGGEYNTIN